MSLTLGPHRIDALVPDTFALDGGAVFGPISKPLWSQHYAPDAENRVRLAARCLLVRTAGRTILVDTGLGTEWSAHDHERLAIDGRPGLDAELARVRTKREDVTDVVLTHLHLASAGGLASKSGLAFPNAVVHVQRRHWHWAMNANEVDAAAFRRAHFEPLSDSGRLHFVEGATELYPGLFLLPSEGHTVGLQLVRLQGLDEWLVFCADLIPTTAHLSPSWRLAHDLYPLTVLEEKKMLVAEALEDGGILVFGRDPEIAACRLGESAEERPVVGERVEL